MLRTWNVRCFCLVSFWVLLPAASAFGQQQAEKHAILHVRLPADARLTVDGFRTTQTGPLRHFHSPALDPSKGYHYTFEWTYRKNGDTYKAKKIVNVKAGDDSEVDLRDEQGLLLQKGNTKPEREPDDSPRKDGKPADKKPGRKLDVIYVPTPPEVVDKMLEMADVRKEDVVYDLGCGDGRIVIAAAKKCGCKGYGFDLDPKRVREARENVKAAGLENLVTIEEKNLFEVDLKPASVVTLYLLDELNVKLVPQLNQLKEGSRIVSHDFSIKGYPPDKTAELKGKEDGVLHEVLLWKAPLKKK